MAISTRGRYGVRALLAVARADKAISSSTVSREENLSLSYLEQIFNRLKHAGLIKAKRGAHGGYTLARPAEEITVGEVIEVLDGPVKFSQCHLQNEEECDRRDTCVSHLFWSSLEQDVNKKLYSTSLKDLSEMENNIRAKV